MEKKIRLTEVGLKYVRDWMALGQELDDNSTGILFDNDDYTCLIRLPVYFWYGPKKDYEWILDEGIEYEVIEEA